MLNALIVIGIVIVLFLIVLVMDMITAYKYHRCPYCGTRMNHTHNKTTRKGKMYVFHCPNCGAWDEVNEEEFLKPFND